MGDVITPPKCAHNPTQEEEKFHKKNALKAFERILDMIIPKYGTPIINLEGSGEPTMAKDLYDYVHAVKKERTKMLHVL